MNQLMIKCIVFICEAFKLVDTMYVQTTQRNLLSPSSRVKKTSFIHSHRCEKLKPRKKSYTSLGKAVAVVLSLSSMHSIKH